jgi:prepilin-type N-terminal cleavage/methylation domain-containing protein
MKTNQHGFTLVEISIVLVIIALLMTTAIAVANSQIAQSRITATRTKAEAIKSSLITYIARNKRLPCPAVPTLEIDDVGYGVEAATTGTCVNVPESGAGAARVVVGIVPWVTLGLTDEATLDGFYNRYTYAVSSAATGLNEDTVAGMLGNITIHTAAPAIAGLPPAGNQSNNCTPAGGNYNPCSVTALIMSHGMNGNGAYRPDGDRVPFPAATFTNELENTNVNAAFVNAEFSVSDVNGFDDILLPATADELLSPLTRTNVFKDYNAELMQNFNEISGAIVTQATRNRAGIPGNNVYPLPAPPAAALVLPANVLVDPWGRNIIYTRMIGSISTMTAPNLLAYTLSSLGPDGIVGGNDDITSTVFVSDLQYKFSTYGW